MKYLDPKADLTFKKIFGNHPKRLISLLNALLPLSEEEQIHEIKYVFISAQKQSQTLGTLCPWCGQPVPSTWSFDAQYMVSKCPCNGHQETMDLI